jgi:hypothetical protein
MPLFNEQELRRKWGTISVEAQRNIFKEQKLYAAIRKYDIFLSHSYADKDLALLLKKEIESMESNVYKVYLDWDDDPELDRTHVTQETAEHLRKVMRDCKCLFYAISINSKNSVWMPWECGYFDGLKGKVAICPASKTQTENSYKGQEYLGLYPYIDEYNGKLFVNKPSGPNVFSNWLKS